MTNTTTVARPYAQDISDRYYQVEAINAVTAGLRGGGRGQLLAACGTGKTVMCLRSAEALCPPGGVVVVVCPTIALVVQTVQRWAEFHRDHVVLAVAGDDTIADSFYTVADIPCPVTTDPARIAVWLARPVSAAIRLVVGTHRSAHVIGEALRRGGTVAELLVVDEAHHAAGRADKHIALVHDDSTLPARRRLYTTATARIMIGNTRKAGEGHVPVVGMDDEEVFGPVLYRYPFSQAIQDGYLDDYRLAVIGVTTADTLALLRHLPAEAALGPALPALRTAAVHAVLARAARQFDLRRVLAFCPLVSEARDFAHTLPRTLAALPEEMTPHRPLHAAHVHGAMSTAQRLHHLARLADPPHDGWTVLANARCLSEGVDVPALDGAVFTHPKKSTIDIVQAVGRVLRRNHNGTGVATIIIPILLADHGTEDDPIDPADYDVLWQVVRALRAHDDVFAADLDQCRAQGYPHDAPLTRLLISLPDGYDDDKVLRDLTVKIVNSATSPWWDGLAELTTYRARHGHLYPPPKYVTDTGHKLGRWTQSVRFDHKHKILPADRLDALLNLGFDFDPLASRWAAGLNAVTEFHRTHGHLTIPNNYQPHGIRAAKWLRSQRREHHIGRLSPNRTALLDALGMNWNPQPDPWLAHHKAFQEFHAQHGHLNISSQHVNTRALARVLTNLRSKRRAGTLESWKIDALNTLGIDWNPRPTRRSTRE